MTRPPFHAKAPMTESSSTPTFPKTWRTPLMVVLAGFLITAVGIGLRNTFGLYLRPMTETYGWGRELFALAIGLQNLIWGLSAPITGAIADRYGTGRVILFGGLVYSLGLYLMSMADTPIALMFSTSLLIGLGTSATGFGVVFGAVGRIVGDKRRSLYLGIVAAGGSFGQFILVLASHGLISNLGWVGALAAVAALCLVIVPLSSVLRGRADRTAIAGVASNPLEAFKEAGSQSRYWLLFAGFFVCGFHITFIATHLPAFLTDRQIAPDVAATGLGLIGLFNILGSLAFGSLGAMYSHRKLLSGLYLLRAVFLALFIMLPLSTFSVYFFAAGMGFLWLGTVPLTGALVSRMYGARYMNTLFSGVFLGHQVGAFLGVWLGGRVFDLTGSYNIVWWLAVGLGVFAALVHWPIDERSPEERALGTGKRLAEDPV